MKDRFLLGNLNPNIWYEKHDTIIERFLNDANTPLLIGYIDANQGLCLINSIPSHQV